MTVWPDAFRLAILRLAMYLDNMKKSTPIEVRFWTKVQKSDGCWIWIGAKTHGGYGVIRDCGSDGKLLRAHRVSWEIANGQPLPSSLDACHTCDTPSCVNPSHIFPGTAVDNARDMVQKGRAKKFGKRNEDHSMAKLTMPKADAIRSSYAEGGVSLQTLANHYAVSKKTILNIVKGRIWRPIMPHPELL